MKSLEQLFGDAKIFNYDGKKFKLSKLEGKLIGLYFSAF
jgi:hypothetical protein